MEININLKINGEEKDIIMDSLEVYSRYLSETINKDGVIIKSNYNKIVELKQKTDEMLKMVRSI